MTVTIDSNHLLEHDKFMKEVDATIKQQSDADVDEVIEIVNELIDALSRVREEEKADFSRNEAMRHKIDLLFEKNPRLFGYEKTHSWNTPEERAEFLLALKEQFKIGTKKSTGKEPIPLDQLLMSNASASEKVTDTPPEEELAEAPSDPDHIPEELVNAVADLLPEETKKWVFKDVNLGMAFINMQVKAFDITEGRIHKLVKQLSHLNEINKDLSDLINAVTGCKEGGKADFSKDPEMSAIIDRVFEVNPKIFGHQKTYAWSTEKQIDVLLSSLDAEVKTKVAEVNQVTMFINVRFDERVQYSENSRKVLDMLIRHCESIISKYHKT
jgi:hypothetical protein